MKKHTTTRRAALAGLILTVSATVLGARPASAAEISDSTLVATRSFDYQPTYTYQQLWTARIGRVGITPIPIP